MSRTRIPSSGRKLIGRWYGGRGESGLGEARGPVSRGSAPESLCADVLDGLERVGMPAYLVDRHGRIRWLNAAFLSLLGDARGRLLSSLAAPDHVQRSREQLARKLDRGDRRGARALRRDGAEPHPPAPAAARRPLPARGGRLRTAARSPLTM